jgi:acyl-CoA thioesterase FadM
MFEASYSIPYAGIGPDGRMKLPVLLDILQDMADRDARRMSMTVSDLLPKGISWVLRRYTVSVERYPEYESTLTVKTWHGPRRNLHSMRAFSVWDERGPVASADTSWILIDLERGRPLRLDRHATPRDVEESLPVTAEFLTAVPGRMGGRASLFRPPVGPGPEQPREQRGLLFLGRRGCSRGDRERLFPRAG